MMDEFSLINTNKSHNHDELAPRKKQQPQKKKTIV
jgi:hypothetical protein